VKHVSERTVNARLVEAETNCIVRKSELWTAKGLDLRERIMESGQGDL